MAPLGAVINPFVFLQAWTLIGLGSLVAIVVALIVIWDDP